MQAGFKADQVQVVGRFSDYSRISDEADRKEHVFHFCPDCGSQVFYTEPTEPDLVVVSVGSFADPPSRRRPSRATTRAVIAWVGLPDSIRHFAPELWDRSRPSTRPGRYAEAADRAVELVAARPDQARPATTTSRAARASRAGRPTPSSTSAARSTCGSGCRDMATEDSDFDPIRDEPAFRDLIGG